ncbi:hypothetical protein FXB40_14070 [Bradyrhizobium rifense]|uniref:Uncharacterized protein n=1 Tax=Bradyrhizobium rifense TaxID=515499 RepID=A0A5D3KJ30_9BRAD|nr:hypothetical protein FXB40_14070 [Bradyrhizobium rifense]
MMWRVLAQLRITVQRRPKRQPTTPLPPPSLRGALATKQSRLLPPSLKLRRTGRYARNDGECALDGSSVPAPKNGTP